MIIESFSGEEQGCRLEKRKGEEGCPHFLPEKNEAVHSCLQKRDGKEGCLNSKIQGLGDKKLVR